ncbi:MAG: S-layer homology domain-containing protein [Armatimonadota bacterium]|nr:S-layer homology domain-containing protein [Armatimonadota bacterium]MDR7452682.1 S-layer homology domain-containing protein [Armatimonadota bacterium]MDR7466712.1 S-layer homology domain-containing protein [Armatimonadota bacterium]MDR7492814.1 S-layer homology domain-containing protein [Armatimonadota bacterium]MDR7498590.1 S-layer homology domain-containing protein [Armatimonadota bacterium]
MGKAVLIVLPLAVIVSVGSAFAQVPPSQFEDVPPWHWAYDAVQKLAENGLLLGYPRDERELALNAVVQVYDAFAHATHSTAQTWAEAFLTHLPPGWPAQLRRSEWTAFQLSGSQVRLDGPRGTVLVQGTVRTRRAAEIRIRLTVTVVRDEAGRWRVDYASLVRGQPDVFR